MRPVPRLLLILHVHADAHLLISFACFGLSGCNQAEPFYNYTQAIWQLLPEAGLQF